MRGARRILLAVGVLIAIVIIAMVAIPVFFGARIEARVKSAVNNSLNARVTWDRSGLSLFRDFPNVSLTLDRLAVVGVKPFDRDTLVSTRAARLVLDLGSVLGYLRRGSPIVVRELAFQQPVAKLRKLVDGTANWDIARKPAGATSATSSAVGITLRDLRISDGSLTLDDQLSKLSASVTGLQESMSGDFTNEKFVLSTRTHADSVSVRFGGVPYLSRAALDINADIDADLTAHRFTFTNDTIRLNRLVLALAGSVTTGTPNVGLDLTFSAPSTQFAEILSLVPAIYLRDFDRLQATGAMSMAGRVRGSYGPRAFPTLAITAKVNNGTFRYPDLPLPAREIAMDLSIDNPGGHVDNTIVDLKRFHAVIGDRPIDAQLTVRTPVSDPDIDLRLRGGVNLGDVARTVKLQGVKELAGIVTADIALRARVSDVDARRYDKVVASGTVNAGRLTVRTDSLPHPITIDTAVLRLTPRTAELTTFVGKIGSSDVRATGSLDNLVGFVLRDEDLRGTATVASTHFDLNEWRSKEKSSEVVPVPPHVDVTVKASAARVTYGPLTASNVRGDLVVKNQRVTMNDLRMEMLRGSIVANGFYETTTIDRPVFGADFRLASLDIPAAFAALSTVKMFFPIARWAEGAVSGAMSLQGALGRDMTPVFAALRGKGEVVTERLGLQSAPVLERLATRLSMEQLQKPGIGAVKASFDIADGRLHVKPFAANVAGVDMTIAGSNGIDQSISYDLGVAVPRALLGSAASSAIAKLAAQAGKAGALATGEVVQLRAQLAGTITDPTVTTNFVAMAASAREAAVNVAREVASSAAETARQKADSAAEEAAQRARAEADRLVAAAERQADTIRAEARALVDKMRREAGARVDSLVARATNPVARIAAQAAGDRLRRETDQQTERVIREADAKADAIVSQAKQKATALVPPAKTP